MFLNQGVSKLLFITVFLCLDLHEAQLTVLSLRLVQLVCIFLDTLLEGCDLGGEFFFLLLINCHVDHLPLFIF